MIAGTSPKGLVNRIKINGSDGAGSAFLFFQDVTHGLQFFSRPRRQIFSDGEFSWGKGVFAKRCPHLIAGNVRCFTSLLHVHSKFDGV